MKDAIRVWAMALAIFAAGAESFAQQTQPADWKASIVTPKPGPAPHLNGARVFGVRAGSPFLFTIPATGDRPMRFSADGLPRGLALDAASGRITGLLKDRGEHMVTLGAANSAGKATRPFKIVVGDSPALTPPMGWNSWYCYWDAVTDEQMRRAADAVVKTDLINHGYVYVNIDDGWAMKPKSPDPRLGGPERDDAGKVNSNAKFPDMKAMTDYIHALGLKAGIYTSPGPLTCAGYVGSYEHEAEDAARFAEWGFDFLKHDWCSYGRIAKDKSLQELQKPYRLMGNLLKQQKRDIVYNLCQYGMGDVSAWGADVGANCWRTAGDLGSHKELYDGLLADGFKLDGKEQWVRPGAYNDPDYLQVGPLYRGARGGRELLPSPMTPDEQYTHMSLWCLLAAPLFIGGDVADLDEFTIALLSNDEVIEVDQDPLCQQAHRIATRGDTQIWAKEMEDGSRAVGLFNIGTSAADAQANWSELGLNGSHRVRDLWRQRELGQIENEFRTKVPAHGVVLVRIFAKE